MSNLALAIKPINLRQYIVTVVDVRESAVVETKNKTIIVRLL